MNPAHLSEHLTQPSRNRKQDEARRRHECEELAKPPSTKRRLLYVRSDIARLLTAFPDGVISDRDRADLQQYVSGSGFATIGASDGSHRHVIKQRLERADQLLRIAEHEKTRQLEGYSVS